MRKSCPKDYRAAYNRLHGQLYLAWRNRGQSLTLGVSGRATRLDFTDLTLNGQPVPVPVADLYGDYSVFARVGQGAFQAHVQVGGSTPLQRQFRGVDSDLYSTATLAGASLIFHPHLLKSSAPSR